jgi:hypothetical protein
LVKPRRDVLIKKEEGEEEGEEEEEEEEEAVARCLYAPA